MDEKFYSYYISNVRWTKFTCDVLYWFIVGILAGFISEFYFTLETCKSLEAELLAKAASDDEFLGDLPQTVCSMETALKSWAAAWFISTLIRIPFLVRQGGPLLKGMGVYLTRLDGKDWNLTNALSYGFIEWLPVLLGAAYVFLFGFPVSLFSAGVHTTIILGAQLIWLAPVLFRFNDRNLAEIITGVSVDATEKKHKKIEKSYSKKFRRALNNFSYSLNYLFYVLITGLFVFSFIQILRVPEQNPAYQETLFGGYEPVWENNIYFAMEGVSAPANVSNFYEYGLKKAYENFKIFEVMKQRSGIDEKYLYKAPDFEGLSVVLDKEHELDINDDEWKNLDCLYDLEAQKDDQCATFSDWKNYVEQNKIMWDRYNRAPDLGNVYVTPPQLLGSKIKNPMQLAELKAVHIIYLAENGRGREAMQEWLKYMNLYTAMAGNRETMVFKAVLAINIGRQLAVLEKLLNIAPVLASTYQQEILQALKNDEAIFNDPYMMADDWGLIEPFSYGAMGNANAVQNDFFKCVEGFKALAEKPLDEYPYTDENIVLCPLHEDRSTLEMALVYPATTPGSYIVNTIYSLLFGGVLKGYELIENMKMTQIRFRQAQLAVTILSQNTPASEIDGFVKTVPAALQNPITNEPFEWNKENQSLSFERPDKKKKHEFRLNLKR